MNTTKKHKAKCKGNIFLSWSGKVSQSLALSLNKWLPLVINAARPWMSEVNIQKGKSWQKEVGEALRDIRFGVVCLTPQNLKSPWILFEAGALAKMYDDTHVFVLLLNVEPKDIPEPLQQFQTTNLDKEDIYRLLNTLNSALGHTLTDLQLKNGFDSLWPQINSEIIKLKDLCRTDENFFQDRISELLDLTKLIHIHISGRLPKNAKGQSRALLTKINNEIEITAGFLGGIKMQIENLGMAENITDKDIENELPDLRMMMWKNAIRLQELMRLRKLVITQFKLNNVPEGKDSVVEGIYLGALLTLPT